MIWQKYAAYHRPEISFKGPPAQFHRWPIFIIRNVKVGGNNTCYYSVETSFPAKADSIKATVSGAP